jgi:hypothetical protein
VVPVCRPSYPSLVAPGGCKRRVLAIAHQVTGLVQQYRGALFIVNRNAEEFRVERYYLERKVGGGVSVAMANCTYSTSCPCGGKPLDA